MNEHLGWQLKHGNGLYDFFLRLKGQKLPEPLIQDILIPHRYAVLSGRSGLGKSLLSTQLMFSFATGKPWIGFEVKQCICLYFNFEVSDLELRERIMLQAKGLPYEWDEEFEPRLCSRPFDPLKNLAELEHIITDGGRMPEVVILDTFRQCYRGKINDNDQVARWVEELSGIATRHKLAFIVVQNTAKAKPFLEAGAMEEPIGAIELANRAVSVLVGVARQKRDDRGRFGSKASDAIELFIPKYGCATKQLETKYLKLNRETLLFEEQDAGSRWH